jgi:hypothetical protein
MREGMENRKWRTGSGEQEMEKSRREMKLYLKPTVEPCTHHPFKNHEPTLFRTYQPTLKPVECNTKRTLLSSPRPTPIPNHRIILNPHRIRNIRPILILELPGRNQQPSSGVRTDASFVLCIRISSVRARKCIFAAAHSHGGDIDTCHREDKHVEERDWNSERVIAHIGVVKVYGGARVSGEHSLAVVEEVFAGDEGVVVEDFVADALDGVSFEAGGEGSRWSGAGGRGRRGNRHNRGTRRTRGSCCGGGSRRRSSGQRTLWECCRKGEEI